MIPTVLPSPNYFSESEQTFSMFIGELEGLHQSQCLINRSANRKIIYCNLTEIALVIDDEQPSVMKIYIRLVVVGFVFYVPLNSLGQMETEYQF